MRISRNVLTAALAAVAVVVPSAGASAAAVTTGSDRAMVGLRAQTTTGYGVCPPATASSSDSPYDTAKVARRVTPEDSPEGFCAGLLPQGWVVQGVSESVLTIAPRHARNQDPSWFEDKLVVMLASDDEIRMFAPEAGVIEGAWGRYMVHDDGSQALVFVGTQGRWLWVQAPLLLGWDRAQLVRFAQGVTVLPEAVAAVG